MTNIAKPGRFARVAAGVLAAVGLTAALSAGASAAPYAGAGTRGTHVIVRPTCTNLPVWGQVRLTAPPPRIFAADMRAGAGNDVQPVRYRVFVVDVRTEQTVASSGYSGVANAWDSSPAAFSGNAVWQLAGGANQYRLDYRIEWLRADNWALSAWVADRVTSYTYFDGQVGPYSPIDRCMGVSYT